jgi:predicted acyl esterase
MKNIFFLSLCIIIYTSTFSQLIPNGKIDNLSEFSTRYSEEFTMPDGTKLMSDIYLPITRDSLVISLELESFGAANIKLFPIDNQYIIYDSINNEPNENPYQLPVLFTRTPYNKNTDTLLGQFLSFMGYAVVIQDMRGRYESEGVYLPMYSDGWNKQDYHPDIKHFLDITSTDDSRNGNFHEDGYNSIKFINDSLKRSYNGNEFLTSIGNIGTFGASAMGNSQFQLASVQKINPESSGLKCLFPMVSTNEHYHATGVQNGVFRESLVKGWISGQLYDNVDTVNIATDNSISNSFHTLNDYNATNMDDLVDDAIDHFIVNQYNNSPSGYYPNSPTRLDMDASFAKLDENGNPDINGAVSRYINLEVPIYHLTGWWDIFIDGQIETFNKVMHNISNDYENKKLQKLVIGPWAHQTIGTRTSGDVTYPENINDFFVDIDNIDDIDFEAGGFDLIANSELFQWFRYNLNYNEYNNVGDPKILISESNEWQKINEFLKVRLPSEDYAIKLLDFINFIGGQSSLPSFPFELDLNGTISTQIIDVPIMDPPMVNLENAIDVSNILEFKNIPNVRLYIVGNQGETWQNGNYWLTKDEFPFTENITMKNFYFDKYNYLAENEVEENDISSIFVHDPNNPVMTLGGGNMLVRTPVDNRKSQGQIDYNNELYLPYILERDDVITFTSSRIADSLSIIGFPEVTLFASSEAIENDVDSLNVDFFVRILDVYPDGREYFVVEGAVNSMARNYAKQLVIGEEDINIPFTNIISGEIYEYNFKMLPIGYTFAKNHKIKVVISSSNHPRYQINSSIPIIPGSFFRREPNDGKTYEIGGEQVEAFSVTQTIQHNATYKSHVKLPVYGSGSFVNIEGNLITNKRNSIFKIYPNPTSSEISIISTEKNEVNYKIVDITGKLILKGKFQNKVHLTTNMSSGLYFVEIKAKNSVREVKKLVVK